MWNPGILAGSLTLRHHHGHIISAALLLLLTATAARGTTVIGYMFGRPIVSESHIIFTEADLPPHRLICLDRKSETKLWEITDPERIVVAWFAPKDNSHGDFVITKGGDVFFCDGASGATTLAYRSGFEEGCYIRPYNDLKVFITGKKNGVDYLQLVDLATGKKHWSAPRVSNVLAVGDRVALCSARHYQGLAAISLDDGTVQWEHKVQATGVTIRAHSVLQYFVVLNGATVSCYEQNSGKLLNSTRLRDGISARIMATKNGTIIAWTMKGSHYLMGYLFYELSVPDLTKTLLTETDSHDATLAAVNDLATSQAPGSIAVHDKTKKKTVWHRDLYDPRNPAVRDGYLYVSAADYVGQHASIEKIVVETGETTTIYRERLPK